jgi:ribosomal protein S18 acetylase RimI-like enzyme
MSNAVLREATNADLPAIEAFFCREGELSGRAKTVLSYPDLRAWVAVDGDALAGAILTRFLPHEHLGGIDELLVDSAYRGRGIGRALIEVAEQHYRLSGAEGMQLTVVAENAAALFLYESAGYEVRQRRLRMRKEFTPVTTTA